MWGIYKNYIHTISTNEICQSAQEPRGECQQWR